MKVALIGLGVVLAVLAVLGLANHLTVRANPVPHTSSVALAVGGALLLAGCVWILVGDRAAN